ncbi:MAG TPA: transglycosylase domain-containing protein [Kofleriaceae bacterium]|nr:transglycosylase domain-containing protein [Kofleriaceae bacterium]
MLSPRRIWRIGRWGLVAVLLPLLIAIQAAMVVVLVLPLDRAALGATSAPLVLLDLRGEEIATFPAEGVDRTRWTALGALPSIAVSAVVESEDEDFWRHGGVDGIAIARAAWLDLRGGRYGASTLTMQVARMVLGNEHRSVTAKLREALLALRIERAVDKRAILEQWMNRAYFGNHVHGFEAAARYYFGKPAAALSDGEATLLAAIPRAPTAYDPIAHLPAAIRRRDYVLDLLVRRGVITETTAREARATKLAVTRHAPRNEAPHFARWIADQLPADVRAAGGTVHTTLDLRLQRVLQARVAEQAASLRRQNLDQAGLVVLDAQTTEVRAMVGSTGWSAPGGQINITTRRRNPGSALKPFVYATAIERGASPATIAWDLRDTSASYFAPNGAEHGPVRYREALGSSYNFAAIDVLEQVGVPRVMSVLRRAGIAELPGAPDDYGLRLALGAAKVRLLDLAAGYGFLVRHGVVGAPHGIEDVVAADGSRWSPPHTPDRRVFSPETSWLVMDMLADPEARRPAFGMEVPLELPFRIAAKTGTARGFSDTWAIGATQEVIVGAWAGTFDGTPTHGLVAMDAAAPLVRDAMLAVAGAAGKLTLPARPEAIEDIEVCAISGMKPGEHCPRTHDVAAHGHGPTEPCTWHQADGSVAYPARAKGWLDRRRAAHARR